VLVLRGDSGDDDEVRLKAHGHDLAALAGHQT